MTFPDRIITHHISDHHAVQGTEAEVRRIVGQLPSDPPGYWNRCEECYQLVGYTHQRWCPEDGIVTEAQTYGGRHLTRQARRTNVQPASAAPAIPAATGDGQDSGQVGARNG